MTPWRMTWLPTESSVIDVDLVAAQPAAFIEGQDENEDDAADKELPSNVVNPRKKMK